jgi:hypothetical protein
MDEEQRSRLDPDTLKAQEAGPPESQPPMLPQERTARGPGVATWLNLLLALGVPLLGFVVARVPGLIVGALIGLGLLALLNRRTP